ncbi:PLP-dependent aspartate aminotransferase family protein [Clostridium sp. BJN0001]|uniref:trans-sulfuration enzyme family protein n=1 Tax=Clostridium sp. BJN0001 TaxID=2930219 RepID=UPI001FD0EF30|nr:PLP-dependent aspartate aminotransferase family protein [Clostridium sp. BJN0001]
MNFETLIVHGISNGDTKTGAISFPIYQTATFKHLGLNKSTGYDYSRDTNPTREEAEKTIAKLENGKYGLAFSSGVAAITCCIHLFNSGDHIILSDDLYGGTVRLFNDTFSQYGITCSFIDTTDTKKIKNSIKPNTKAIFIETPSNPLLKVTDIKAVSDISIQSNLILLVDNTFLTPFYQKPLNLGADIVIHSGTKYLSGHNDSLSGLIVTNKEFLYKKLKNIQMTTGAILSPFDSWLLLRGIKTLSIRLKKSQQNAIKISDFLQTDPNVSKVYYTGLKDFDGYETNAKQSSGFGSTISFKVKDKYMVKKILDNVKIISFAESLGGVETLITYPYTQTHADVPDYIKKRLGIDEFLLRISVGIEDSDDLINDLKNAINL